MQVAARWRPSTLIAAAGCLLALLVLVGTGVSLLRDRDELRNEASERLALLARVLEDHAARAIDSSQIALSGLADVAARGTPPEVLQALLGQTQTSLPFLRGVALLDASGQVLVAADPADRGIRIDPQALGTWPAPGSDALGRFVPTRSLVGLRLDAPALPVPRGVGFFPLLRTLRLPGGHSALMVALLNPDAIANFQQVTLNDEVSAAALLSLNGQVLASTDRAELLPGERALALGAPGAPLARVLSGSEHGLWQGAGLRAEPQLGAYRALRARPLLVVAELPQAELTRQWMDDLRGIGLPALLVAAALLTLSLVGARAVRTRERTQHALAQAQQRIADRERELSAIFGSVQDLLFRTDAGGQVIFINERYSQLSGQSVARATGRPLHEVFGGSAAVAALFHPAPTSEDEPPRRARADWTDASGQARSFEVTLVPLRRQTAALEWVGSATDVSSLMRAQAELNAQLGLARSLLASSPLPMSVLDRNNRYLDVNRAWEQFTGRQRSTVLGRRAASYLPPAEAALHDARDAELLATGGETRYEAVWHGRDGRRRDLYISKSTFPDASGRPMGIVVSFMDISEFREAERATRAARDAALATSQAKSEFIANVSHELRTPLQSILGFSELGRARTGAQQPRLSDMFNDIHRAGQRMLGLVNDLLDLSKIEQANDPLQPERQDLRPLLREVVAELQPLLDARRLRLECRLGGAQIVALVDAPRMQQVLRNVLANAIKFSPEGGPIEVSARYDDQQHICLEVADRGPGIPEAELDSVFEAFVQSSATKDGSGGTGLGLAICRRIMNAHGGRIWASNREGGGSVLHLQLPAAHFGDTAPATL
ncbi:MAG: PAS domain-containing sensor histidine kinase [Roseateles sp.]|nr:MAG: PAS domain-containing sensor histidine kinase [Roseateles sp.]